MLNFLHPLIVNHFSRIRSRSHHPLAAASSSSLVGRCGLFGAIDLERFTKRRMNGVYSCAWPRCSTCSATQCSQSLSGLSLGALGPPDWDELYRRLLVPGRCKRGLNWRNREAREGLGDGEEDAWRTKKAWMTRYRLVGERMTGRGDRVIEKDEADPSERRSRGPFIVRWWVVSHSGVHPSAVSVLGHKLCCVLVCSL